MHICKTVSELNYHIDFVREKGQEVGFVPTMGALHEGHLSLLRTALVSNDVAVCSIFVNPTQFNDINDLNRYPRMPEADLLMLKAAGCHVVFLPEVAEIYKPGEPLLELDFGELERTMEGHYRPGHFKGVATVVDKLFKIVRPAKAYFGEKDFQQLAVIRQMTKTLNHKVAIIGCPTLREKDGLAMSSRNMLLTPDQRKAAPLIFKTISEAGRKLNSMSFSDVKSWVNDTLNANPALTVQYFDIVHPDTLLTIADNESVADARGCIAVLTEGPRLIDNVAYHL